MLGQIRFPPVLRIADLASLGPLQDAIRAEFPTFAQEQQMSFTVGPDGPQSASSSRAYRFSTSDASWSVLLTPDVLTLEADVGESYTSYDEFVKRFRLVWGATLDHFAPSQVVRQGLRYVDHLEGDRSPAEWAKLVNKDLLGPLAGVFGQSVAQSVSELRFRREDGVLVFKHGMLPLGPDAKMGYLLDFDYFNEQPHDDVSVDSVAERFDSFHELIYNFFRWCVTKEATDEFRREH
ncbi:MAG TPA: TIGR04255 family protein [Solirubrobacteraceae bacterium]|jgi:uncharacterized protein (TIGR04255 family)